MEGNLIATDNEIEEWTERFSHDFFQTIDGRRNQDRFLSALERFVEGLRGSFPDEEVDRLIIVIRIKRLKLWGIDIGWLIRYATRGYLGFLPYLAGSISIGSILGLIVAVLTTDNYLVPMVIAIVLAITLIIFSSIIMFVTWRLRARFRL